ncbi:hypothetical protein OG218_00425 [Kineococcus sp. NBC_00420]|uniref:hypothetical protein n=1 Tax=Kineococcus sp. NBC_00420 TaxID=2903564 RepID=UPI002E1FA1D2
MTTTGLPDGSESPADSRAGRVGDGFGIGAARWWRRLAGAGVVAMLATAFGALATGEDGVDRDAGFWALVVLGCSYAGVLVSFLVSGAARGGRLVVRHAGAGAGLGLVLGVALTLWVGDVVWLWLWLLICLPAGALVGAITAWVALTLPRQVVPWVALLGVVATASLVWSTFRPQPPYDLFAVDATEQVSAAGGAVGLADRVRAAVERTSAGDDFRADTFWEAVSDEVSGDLGGARPHLRFTVDEDLPVSTVTGERVRVMTVQVRGGGAACVITDAGAVRVVDGACEDLDVVRE